MTVCMAIHVVASDDCHFVFFFNDTATTEIYTLSLHDALPISYHDERGGRGALRGPVPDHRRAGHGRPAHHALKRSEEHTSELQSQSNLVCRLLLEKKKILILIWPPTPQPVLVRRC